MKSIWVVFLLCQFVCKGMARSMTRTCRQTRLVVAKGSLHQPFYSLVVGHAAFQRNDPRPVHTHFLVGNLVIEALGSRPICSQSERVDQICANHIVSQTLAGTAVASQAIGDLADSEPWRRAHAFCVVATIPGRSHLNWCWRPVLMRMAKFLLRTIASHGLFQLQTFGYCSPWV